MRGLDVKRSPVLPLPTEPLQPWTNTAPQKQSPGFETTSTTYAGSSPGCPSMYSSAAPWSPPKAGLTGLDYSPLPVPTAVTQLDPTPHTTKSSFAAGLSGDRFRLGSPSARAWSSTHLQDDEMRNLIRNEVQVAEAKLTAQVLRIQDDEMRNLIRNEVQVAEAKLTAQVLRIQDELRTAFSLAEQSREITVHRLEQRMFEQDELKTASSLAEQSREIAVHRLEKRMVEQESLLASFSRRTSELTSALRGFAEDEQRERRGQGATVSNGIVGFSAEAEKRLDQNLIRLEAWCQEHGQAFQIQSAAVEQMMLDFRQRLHAVERRQAAHWESHKDPQARPDLNEPISGGGQAAQKRGRDVGPVVSRPNASEYACGNLQRQLDSKFGEMNRLLESAWRSMPNSPRSTSPAASRS